MMQIDDTRRACIRHLKDTFLAWRDPPVELPAEHVIEEAVDFILRAGIARAAQVADDADNATQCVVEASTAAYRIRKLLSD